MVPAISASPLTTEYPDYLYDMFAGVDYEIDRQPRVSVLKRYVQGEPLRDDENTLAVNNYRYSSALKSKVWYPEEGIESSSSILDMIVAYFAEHSPVAPSDNWKIVGVDLQLDNPKRAEIIEKSTPELETPILRVLT